jgi:hypothetical protein
MIQPISIVVDDGDVRGAVCANFDDEWEAHLRFAVDDKSNLRLLGIYRDPESSIRGADMVAWLRDRTHLRVIVDEVAVTAVGFWKKMQDRGLVDELRDEPFEGDTVDAIDSLDRKKSPRPR